ncbi:MAG: hypothetical protein GY906_33145 [bacterium]|nr:hypothetical protein [bacterium]
MKKKILGVAVMSMCAVGAFAEPPVPIEIAEQSMDVSYHTTEPSLADSFVYDDSATAKRPRVTEETVGDPYSFGRHKTYLGVAQTEQVVFQADCSTYPTDYGRCIEPLPAPATTSIDETDLGSIELPRKSTKSLLCFTFTPFANWQWSNYTGSTQTAQMFLRPSVRIESEVLNDPALIDPGTGLPFNGVLLDSTISTFLQMRTLDPNETDFQFRATTRSCTGGLVNVRALRDTYGLPASVIKKFFKKPIKVTFGVRGSVSMVEHASYSVGVRLYGD